MTRNEHRAAIAALSMTTAQYLEALAALGLGTASLATAAALGLSRPQAQKIAAGVHKVPVPVAMLLRIYLKRDYILRQTVQVAAEQEAA
jgi:hypothetical protein